MIDHTNSVTKKPSLFEIVGLVTVLVSVFFVGYELRQANKIARVETEWQLMNTYASWDEAIISCPECFIQSASAFSSTTEYMRVQSIIYRAINAWQAGEIGYDEGLLSQRTFNLFYRDANIFINQAKEAGTLALWKQTLDENPDWTDSIVFQHLYDLISNAESVD